MAIGDRRGRATTLAWLDDADRRDLAAVFNSASGTFSSLAKCANLNPKMDFRFADLSGVDFSSSDLRGFDFSEADLSNTSWIGADWDDSTILSGALLVGAKGLYQSRNPSSQVVAHYLPSLRHYARALVGEQSRGDACVAIALEALTEDPTLLNPTEAPRVAAYQLLTRTFSSARAFGPAISHLVASSRQAFVLMMVEDFTESEAARILDIDVKSLRLLIEQSGREMVSDAAVNVLIIENEEFIALELTEIVESLGHRVMGVAPTHKRAVAIANMGAPGLIISDVKLADGSSGLDAVNELTRDVKIPVVFVTAFPQLYLTGHHPEPAFLVAKPFQPAAVSAAVSQALFCARIARSLGHTIDA
jgi:CheY-like chemotaxis protein/DNA-directed RNA polymerase specialized sigma24 family protein